MFVIIPVRKIYLVISVKPVKSSSKFQSLKYRILSLQIRLSNGTFTTYFSYLNISHAVKIFATSRDTQKQNYNIGGHSIPIHRKADKFNQRHIIIYIIQRLEKELKIHNLKTSLLAK